MFHKVFGGSIRLKRCFRASSQTSESDPMAGRKNFQVAVPKHDIATLLHTRLHQIEKRNRLDVNACKTNEETFHKIIR